MDSRELSTKARALGGALEPIIGQVYFSPECHANYVALGFQPSPGDMNGVALPEGVAYFTSRGSLMGHMNRPRAVTMRCAKGRRESCDVERQDCRNC